MSSISVQARLEFQKVALGKKKEAHLLITLEGQKFQGDRKPLSLAAVIDVSGSMGGEKIDHAKRSLRKLVEHMTDQDTLAILAFSTDVFTVLEPERMTQEAKDRALAEIQNLHVIDSTNLSGATLEGYGAIRKAVEKKLKGSIERVFLFTDGQPTAGDTSFSGLVEIAKSRKPEGCGLTCFGYGHDYNKELMTAMTKAGGGNEYQITTPDQAPAAFGREIGGLLSCVAQAVKVTVKTKTDVKIKEVLNDFDVKGNDEETEAMISVDDVYGQERRKLLLRLELPEIAKDAAPARPLKLGDVRVTFEDLIAKEPRFEEVSFKVEYVKEADADQASDKEVAEQIAIHKAAKAQEEAIKLAGAGNFRGANQVMFAASVALDAVGTQGAQMAADDLRKNVSPWLTAEKFAQGGAHYVHSNKRSYSVGRGQTAGSAGLYNTEAQAQMEKSFNDQRPLPNAQVPAGHGGAPFVPAVDSKTTLSKKRTRR